MSDEKKPVTPAPAAPAGPPPPKHPGRVTFTVDGREVVAAPGTNMIDAAKTVGVDIPYYCYHPHLSIAANCRMCLVESSAVAKGKLVPACQTAITEGVSIGTTSGEVKNQQREVMEFLLLNHPVDCSICDQSGECKLQDYYMKFDSKPSRLIGDKLMRNKRRVLSDMVVLDQERCILCTRCVRFMSEVAKSPQLGVFGRSSSEYIDISPDREKLESNYSGNIVDICPVGALLNRDFRFRARAWFLSTEASVCAGCARGCNIQVDFMGQDTYRFRPRENEAINQSWMCDQGRLSYKEYNGPRVVSSSVRDGNGRAQVTHVKALAEVAAALAKWAGKVAVLVSPGLSNEDILACLTLSKSGLGQSTVYVTGAPPGASDHLLMMADKNPNRRGLTDIARALGIELRDLSAIEKPSAVLAFGHALPIPLDLRSKGVEYLAVVASRETAFGLDADALLASATHLEAEGTFTQEAGIIQRFRRAFPPRGESLPAWQWATELAQQLGVASATATTSREVFMSHKASVPEFATYDWDASTPESQARKGISTLPAGGDGRPPGWREQGVPNLHGLTIP